MGYYMIKKIEGGSFLAKKNVLFRIILKYLFVRFLEINVCINGFCEVYAHLQRNIYITKIQIQSDYHFIVE